MNETNSENLPPKNPNNWLQRLKDESWEAELLVSAIAIFGTFQLFKVINWVTNMFIDWLVPEQYIVGYFISFMGLLAVSILVSMFVIHFLLRAYWIGLVGLNSVFPDYSLKDSVYSEIYTKRILAILPKLKDSIQKIDDLCSVTFSAAFAILLIYTYLAVLTTFYLFLYNFLVKFIPPSIALIPAIASLFLALFQSIFVMVANLKKYKQNEKMQIWLFKIVKLTSIIILGPLYKYLLQITMSFASNFKQNKALIRYVILFVLSGIFVASYQISNTNILYLAKTSYYFDSTKNYAGYYETENKNIDFLLTPEIKSDIIEKKVLKLFIPIFEHEKTIRKNTCPDFENNDSISKKENSLNNKINYLNCYHLYNEVFLNNIKLTPKYRKYYHPRTNQFGVLAYIKLSDIEEGEQIITIKKNYEDKEHNSEWNIPFQYITNN
ncbi:hypothetical protein D1815_03450 [Aquimarina sp. AD1]|uniref:hypothetical protein n=3 Tax=Aquimarina sp. (strain AD1) TaxID=1714848 RepID=UPI000E475450|nr:hypothetical protein [Aquimarina sp. AD1]AXT54849.1 hypothetical protein D1815_03450 [Aquimarina sp. AD1]